MWWGGMERERGGVQVARETERGSGDFSMPKPSGGGPDGGQGGGDAHLEAAEEGLTVLKESASRKKKKQQPRALSPLLHLPYAGI
mmetsp:Transcript_22288/g.43357  ORF Transcript_22288/g.43357 Transcript_22288/m.43357 type:complete len:85 (+) Transcript_22288:394-648(+)